MNSLRPERPLALFLDDLQWLNADGKVRQLDELYPHLSEEEPVPGPTNTIGTSVERLDLATVIKVSQTVSGEIVLEKLIDTLMREAIEHAGAERGLLILPRDFKRSIEAEAMTSRDTIIVRLREAFIAQPELPESFIHLCRADQGERDSRRCGKPTCVSASLRWLAGDSPNLASIGSA